MGIIDNLKSGLETGLKGISGVKTVLSGMHSLYPMPTGDMPVLAYDIRIEERLLISYDGKEQIVVTVTIQGAIDAEGGKTGFWAIVEGVQKMLYSITVSGASVERVRIERFDLLDDNISKSGIFEMTARIILVV